MDKLLTMFANWKTSLVGLLVLACSGGELINAMPESIKAKGYAICGILIAFGFIASKDADKSNASSPTTAPRSTT